MAAVGKKTPTPENRLRPGNDGVLTARVEAPADAPGRRAASSSRLNPRDEYNRYLKEGEIV
jgi:hypothetical protein